MQKKYGRNLTLDDIREADSKQIIRTCMRTPGLYREFEMVIQATVIGAIKICVESVAECVKIGSPQLQKRKINDSTANEETFIAVNGP